VTLTVFDNTIFVLQRNPLAVVLGAQSRAGYIGRVNPSYAGLMHAMDGLPANARVYSLFEPRSYALPRPIQPDPVNYNFSHDLFLYGTPSGVIQRWKMEGYTHILVSEEASDKFNSARRAALRQTLAMLELVEQTPDRLYSIYRLP
jgi:hypothetical protein